MGEQYILLTLEIKKEDGQYAAYCRELGTATCGDTLDEAQDNIVQAVILDLNTLEDIGERDRFFKERGIKVYRSASKRKQAREVPVAPDSWASNRPFPIACG